MNKSNPVYQLTVDTNVIMELWKRQEKACIVEKLLDLAKYGQVDLAITARVHEDVPNPPFSERLNQLEVININEVPSVTRLDCWELGRDILADDNFVDTVKSIVDNLQRASQKPPDWRDFDHIHAHFLLQRDVFLTWDGQILNISKDLHDQLGIVIMSPESFLEDYQNM